MFDKQSFLKCLADISRMCQKIRLVGFKARMVALCGRTCTFPEIHLQATPTKFLDNKII